MPRDGSDAALTRREFAKANRTTVITMSLPTIALVTPSLNQGRFIRSAIQSVLAQEYSGLEYLVMDGGSIDDSCEVTSEFEPLLTLIREKDEGQSDAINKGFSRVSGEIIGWLNADDYYAPGTLEKIATVFAEHPEVGLVYGHAEYVDEVGQPLGPAAQIEPFDLDRLLTIGNFIVQPSAFFRRSAFEAVGGLRKDLHWSMDYDLWIRLGKRYRVLHIPETLAYVRCYAGTKTALGGRRRFAEVEQVIRSNGGSSLPVYFRMEAAMFGAREAMQFVRMHKFRQALGLVGSAVGEVACSPRTTVALASLRTWRVILAARKRNSRINAGA